MKKPELLLIAGDSTMAHEIVSVLEKDFVVRILSPDMVTDIEVNAHSYFVCLSGADSIEPNTFRCIQANVTGKNGVLLLLASALSTFGTAFSSFIGSYAAREPDISSLKLHVFPHFLTRSMPELIEIHDAIRANLTFDAGFSHVSDNVFVEDMDGTPIAYERVFGVKGRVIVLSAGGDELLSGVETGILQNLRLLLHTAEQVDLNFGDEITQEISFRDDIITERAKDICRWNTLFTQDKTDFVYTHSAVFLPGSPEFCRDRISHLVGLENMELTKEQLWQSFAGIEIRNTDYCQQNCYYCYNRRNMDVVHKRVSLPKETHIALEQDLIRMKVDFGLHFFVRYTGTGEPLCCDRTLPSLLSFEHMGIPTALVTNGALLSSGDTSLLRENASFVRFSVDASEAQSYADIRRCDEADFEQVLHNIAAVSGGQCYTGATFLTCRENFRQIFDFCKLMKSLGVRAVWIRSTDNCDPFSADEIALIHSDIDRALALTDESFIVTANQFKVYRDIALLHYKYDTARCWAGHTKAFVQPDGAVVICLSRPDYVIGNINQQNFTEIWGGEKHLHFLRDTDITACSQCIESRYNAAVDFLARNHDKTIFKGTRELAL
ncbi:MAG: SPASM domain-containing protein [Clostridiales bacterium]|jgi:MoaA/NifB/PqqE/SkfB family radical SAM enzyme|nr:SPASM domain-containing protein [Clostridiales bacterium]